MAIPTRTALPFGPAPQTNFGLIGSQVASGLTRMFQQIEDDKQAAREQSVLLDLLRAPDAAGLNTRLQKQLQGPNSFVTNKFATEIIGRTADPLSQTVKKAKLAATRASEARTKVLTKQSLELHKGKREIQQLELQQKRNTIGALQPVEDQAQADRLKLEESIFDFDQKKKALEFRDPKLWPSNRDDLERTYLIALKDNGFLGRGAISPEEILARIGGGQSVPATQKSEISSEDAEQYLEKYRNVIRPALIDSFGGSDPRMRVLVAKHLDALTATIVPGFERPSDAELRDSVTKGLDTRPLAKPKRITFGSVHRSINKAKTQAELDAIDVSGLPKEQVSGLMTLFRRRSAAISKASQ